MNWYMEGKKLSIDEETEYRWESYDEIWSFD